MTPAEIIALINVAEQLAVLIDQQVTASNNAQEQIAWTAAQQFYLQGLNSLKIKAGENTGAVTGAA